MSRQHRPAAVWPTAIAGLTGGCDTGSTDSCWKYLLAVCRWPATAGLTVGRPRLMIWTTSGTWKFPTNNEFRVIGFCYTLLVIVLFSLGVYVFYLSFGQPPEKSHLAAKARWIGPCIMVTAAVMKPGWAVAVFNWIVCRLHKRLHDPDDR
jgi:hypothetical protein